MAENKDDLTMIALVAQQSESLFVHEITLLSTTSQTVIMFGAFSESFDAVEDP